MTMLLLRFFLSEAHARGFRCTGLVDRRVEDPLLEERLIRIRAQLTAALALHSMLTDMGFVVEATIDLHPLVQFAQGRDIIGRREASILMQINKEANEAKHLLVFLSRL